MDYVNFGCSEWLYKKKSPMFLLWHKIFSKEAMKLPRSQVTDKTSTENYLTFNDSKINITEL